jgi:hypothetical protein
VRGSQDVAPRLLRPLLPAPLGRGRLDVGHVLE